VPPTGSLQRNNAYTKTSAEVTGQKALSKVLASSELPDSVPAGYVRRGSGFRPTGRLDPIREGKAAERLFMRLGSCLAPVNLLFLGLEVKLPDFIQSFT